jgi:hypothetical protein
VARNDVPARCLVELQAPPSTYAIAAWLDGEKGSAMRVAGLTVQRAVFIGSGLFLAGFRNRDLVVGALAASATVTAWIAGDYSIKKRRAGGR